MKLPARSVAWLLPLLLTACFHKSNSTQAQPPLAPPIEDAPLPKPVPSPTDLPPPVVTVPTQTPPPASASTQPKPAPKPPVKHKKAPPAATTQQASNESPGVSAIGQLSSGDPSDLKRQTADSIASTERALNGIGRKLNDQEQKTAVQIREYLKQATAALSTGDLDGARTLVAKAKVLLGELSV
jgi:outer membrane biosynthesis protein TonB